MMEHLQFARKKQSSKRFRSVYWKWILVGDTHEPRHVSISRRGSTCPTPSNRLLPYISLHFSFHDCTSPEPRAIPFILFILSSHFFMPFHAPHHPCHLLNRFVWPSKGPGSKDHGTYLGRIYFVM